MDLLDMYVALNKNDELLAYASNDSQVYLRNVSDLRDAIGQIRNLTGHRSMVRWVAFNGANI